jgi:predicted Zn-dependent protease
VMEELRAPNADAPEEKASLPNDSLPDAVIPLPSSAPMPPDVQPGPTPSPRVSNAKPSVVEQPPAEDAVRAPQERASRLREESRSLGDARAALRRGDAASALEKLDALGGQFPEGVLAQEREVLAIEALAGAGQRAAASARAAAFLQAHPTSPHATKVRGFLQ